MTSAERKKYIRGLANDEWGDGLKLSKRAWNLRARKMQAETHKFCQMTSAANELHYFVSVYNWDKGYEHMREIANNPHCEAATALMMYWKAGPEYFLQFANRSEVPAHSLSGFDFLTKIETRYLAGHFPAKSIKFDPAEHSGEYGQEQVRKWQRKLSKVMYKPVSIKSRKTLKPSWAFRLYSIFNGRKK